MFYKKIPPHRLFKPTSSEPFKVSRSKVELYLSCERCFYLDRRLGVPRPPMMPFNLNIAVDVLWKKEFDIHRKEGTKHPLMEEHKIDAVPFRHEKMDMWREPLKGGISYHDTTSNLILYGAPDDVWVTPQDELIIVDYKATSKDGEVSLDAPWHIAYKRQLEVYQWLFGKNGFSVSPTGYFLYANGDRKRDAFNNEIQFKVKVIPHRGTSDWIPGVLKRIRECLTLDTVPAADTTCDVCTYRGAARGAFLDHHTTTTGEPSQKNKE